MRPCVNTFRQSNQIYLKHHWGFGKAVLGYGYIRYLVSMATGSSNRGIMGKRFFIVFSTVFDRVLLLIAGNDAMHKSLNEFEIRPDPTTDYGVRRP